MAKSTKENMEIKKEENGELPKGFVSKRKELQKFERFFNHEDFKKGLICTIVDFFIYQYGDKDAHAMIFQSNNDGKIYAFNLPIIVKNALEGVEKGERVYIKFKGEIKRKGKKSIKDYTVAVEE